MHWIQIRVQGRLSTLKKNLKQHKHTEKYAEKTKLLN